MSHEITNAFASQVTSAPTMSGRLGRSAAQVGWRCRLLLSATLSDTLSAALSRLRLTPPSFSDYITFANQFLSRRAAFMASNRGVAYMGPGKVEVQSIDFPKLALGSRKCEHGVILKIISTNICGSDQHMVRGRTTAPQGLILGHEITGEVIEAGRDVEFVKVGDLVSVPFNIACGRCRNCKEGNTGICLHVNPARPGAAYGYVDMGGWIGGQAEYVMVPYADFNLLRLPDKARAMAKIKDLTLLSDIIPTGYHGAVSAGVGPGSIVYVAGAGPVGLACAACCQLLGAACVIVGIPEVECAVDCVGFEARGHGKEAVVERPATVLNSVMSVTQAGGRIGIPGLYVTDDPGRSNRSDLAPSRRHESGNCSRKSVSPPRLPSCTLTSSPAGNVSGSGSPVRSR